MALEREMKLLILVSVLLVLVATPVMGHRPVYSQQRGLSQFESVEEAQAWLDEHRLPTVLIADSQGEVELNRTWADPRFDCDDYAQWLEDLALVDGYVISQVPVWYGRIWGIRVTSILGSHVGNWTKINETYYYVEASPTRNRDDRMKLVRVADAD